MKKNKILIIILIIILVLILTVIGIVVYGNNGNNVIDIPNDSEFTDNKELYGNWKSTKMEIYENGNLISSYIDIDDKKLVINSDEVISVCHLDNNEKFNCTDSKYSYIDNKLYIASDTYLDNESEVTFGEISMIIKATLDQSTYMYLYFERE